MDRLNFLSEMLELIGEELTQTQVRNYRYHGNLNFDKDKVAGDNELGRGYFSRVNPDKNDPHMVIKRSTSPMGPNHARKGDGFQEYVKMLVDNKLMDNIHFPKVYKAKTVVDKSNTHRNTFTIERLQSIESISKEEFESLVERHLLRPVADAEGLADRISGACHSEYDRKNYIRMESLKEACEIIEELDNISHFRLDIHEDNLMVRRTPHGLQLVISDPFGLLKNGEKYNPIG